MMSLVSKCKLYSNDIAPMIVLRLLNGNLHLRLCSCFSRFDYGIAAFGPIATRLLLVHCIMMCSRRGSTMRWHLSNIRLQSHYVIICTCCSQADWLKGYSDFELKDCSALSKVPCQQLGSLFSLTHLFQCLGCGLD